MILQMPVMDGFEATRRIRQNYPDLLVVALSAAVMEMDQQKAKDTGVNAHLAKLIDSREIYASLTHFLKDHGATQDFFKDPLSSRDSLSDTLEGFDLKKGLLIYQWKM